MAQRDSNNTLLHDRVIDEVIHVLNPKDYDIYTNPGSQKNAGINDNYPDVIMTEKGNKIVKFIIEVETIDSINLNEAETQWKKFATEINCTFYLLVPDSSLNRANDLCKQVGVNVRFAQYSMNNNGVITFNFN